MLSFDNLSLNKRKDKITQVEKKKLRREKRKD